MNAKRLTIYCFLDGQGSFTLIVVIFCFIWDCMSAETHRLPSCCTYEAIPGHLGEIHTASPPKGGLKKTADKDV